MLLCMTLVAPDRTSSAYRHSSTRNQSVLLVVDDMSRPTPVREVLESVLDEVHRAGVQKSQVWILIALGTHRFMTEQEIDARFGERSSPGRIEIKNHEWNNPHELHDYGTLEDGTHVVLNKAMHESDFVIGIGSIAPHPAAGFSGGGKIITPGVATDEAAGDFHWESVQYPQEAVLGVRDNPMRERIDAIARLGGLKYIVNVIMDGSNRVVGAVCGDPVEATRIGAARALDIFGVQIDDPQDADVFIIDTHPLDQELWQGVKALCALECIVPDHAICIIVSPLPEGICRTHPEVLVHGFQPVERSASWSIPGRCQKLSGTIWCKGEGCSHVRCATWPLRESAGLMRPGWDSRTSPPPSKPWMRQFTSKGRTQRS